MAAVSEPVDRRDQVERFVVDVARAVKGRLAPVVSGMRVVLLGEIPELSEGDPRLVNLLDTAIESNVDTILHILQHSIKPRDFELPSGATEHARRLAQYNVPIDSLIRAYRLGQRYLLEQFFDEIHSTSNDPQLNYSAVQRLILVTFAYIDRASQEIVAVYADERIRWSETRDTARTGLVRELLAGSITDIGHAEATLNYRLRQHHLGAVLWADISGSEQHVLGRVKHVVSALGPGVGLVDRPLMCACDGRSMWVWFPLGSRGPQPDVARLQVLVDAASHDLRVALGAPGAGIEGFRATHQQAAQTQRLVLTTTARRTLVSFTESGVPTATLLTGNLDHTRNLVRSVLGPLAQDDPGTERLREALLEFLLCGSSYTAAADRLLMHKNTVKYRVARAQEHRGTPLGDDRADVELALVACRWLGAAVLARAAPSAG